MNYCSVCDLELPQNPTWQEIEESINEQLAAAREQGIEVIDFQLFENSGNIHLIIKTNTEHDTILLDEDIQDLM